MIFCYTKIVLLLTTIITLNECKPECNVIRWKSFCEEGLAIDYEDKSQLGMTDKLSKLILRILYTDDWLFVLTNRNDLHM